MKNKTTKIEVARILAGYESWTEIDYKGIHFKRNCEMSIKDALNYITEKIEEEKNNKIGRDYVSGKKAINQ
jgi:hypothetical protein